VLPAAADVVIAIDKSAQRMTVAVDGAKRWTWPVSTGARGYDTPSGSYTAFRMEKDYSSKEWDDAPMPYSIFFTKEGPCNPRQLRYQASGGDQFRMVVCGCTRPTPPSSML